MDLNVEAGVLSTHIAAEEQAGQQGLPLSSTHCVIESGGTILLQLLEFKTHLFEAVEELHIRRDAETRYEDQLSKLIMEKQELEWEKESLEKQIEKLAIQNKESLSNAKKQFQEKIKSTEEEKRKYQITAELKDKEIKTLKEELKSLQLLKYNLEMKSSELQQKLALQTRSKENHLNQLGEVEKRFTALSRQCAMIKQAHEELEENVSEAMNLNKKLSSVNTKQESTIDSLKKDLEELSKQLIKARMTSVTHDPTYCSTGKEQHMNQLHQKLKMETIINKKLWEENKSARVEKQEVIKSLQHSQHLLLSQTKTVSKVELELQIQRDLHQTLKQEHEMMQEKCKALEDKVAQLTKSYTASKTSWDKEKTVLLDRIKNQQQDLQIVQEACDALHQKHTELSSPLKAQAQQICESEMKESGQVLSVSTEILPTLVEEVSAETSPIPSSELCVLGNLQRINSSMTNNPDSLENTDAVNKLIIVEMGEQEPIHHDHQSEPSMCPPITNNAFCLGSHSGQDMCPNRLNEFTCNSNRTGSDHGAVLDLGSSASSDNNHHNFRGNRVSRTTNVSSPDHKTVTEYVDLVHKYKHQKRKVVMDENNIRGQGEWKQERNNSKEENRYIGQQWNREELLRKDVKGSGQIEERSEILVTQTTDRADRQEDIKGSTEDTGDTRNTETETQDRVDGEAIDEGESRGKTAAHTSETPESQIRDQTAADSTIEKSNQQQVIDFMDTKPSLPVSVASDSAQNISAKNIDSNCIHANKGLEEITEEQVISNHNFVDCCNVNSGPSLQNLGCYQDADFNQLLNNNCDVLEKATPEDELCYRPAPELSDPLNHPHICGTQKDAPLNTIDPCDFKSSMKQTGDIYDMNVTNKCLSESQSSQIRQNISEQVTGQEDALVTDVTGTSEGQSTLHLHEKSVCQSVQKPGGTCSGVMNITELASEVQSSISKNDVKNVQSEGRRYAKTTPREITSKPHRSDEPAEARCPKSSNEPPSKRVLLHPTHGSFLQSGEMCKSSFDCVSAQRKAENSKAHHEVSTSHSFFEGTEQHTSWSGGDLRHPFSTIPNFLKGKCNKVPLVITRASELLNASSVSGTAAFSRKNPQGEWKAIGETCRDTENRGCLSVGSSPSPAFSGTVTNLSWQPPPGSSKVATSASGIGPDFQWEPSGSQDREEQQLSLRAQISKIEQFLNKDRLCLPKRQKTDN